MEGLSEAEALEFLASADVAHLAVVDAGRPYVTPHAFVVDGRRVLFRTGPGKRLSAIRQHPEVSLEASFLDHRTGHWVSVIAAGPARVTGDDYSAVEALGLLADKYRRLLDVPLAMSGLQPLLDMTFVVQVVIQEISGVCSNRKTLARALQPRR
jgi:nitroimidazol reductase NimA-like FMN-containing flavoprotein (pyridoxamine 5'-phosphate oxidase superfamily)